MPPLTAQLYVVGEVASASADSKKLTVDVQSAVPAGMAWVWGWRAGPKHAVLRPALMRRFSRGGVVQGHPGGSREGERGREM